MAEASDKLKNLTAGIGAEDKIYIPDHTLRDLLVLLSDGQLLIAKGHSTKTMVISYIAKLDKMKQDGKGIKFIIKEVDIEEIRNINERTNSQGFVSQSNLISEQSRIQKEIITLLQDGYRQRAADIHVRNYGDKCEIWYRVDNDLKRVNTLSSDMGRRIMSTLYQTMCDVSGTTYKERERQDARIGSQEFLPKGLSGVRVATTPQVSGSLMVLRLLYNDNDDNFELAPLGLNPTHIKLMQYLLKKPTGLIIISGPTGSGKSTTLQRVLGGVMFDSKFTINCITVEDPPEYKILGTIQTPVAEADTEEERQRQFHLAIKAAMRLDPDILMIGEIRDLPSAELTLRGAMTGHVVFATIHANNGFGIIDRLVDIGVPMELIADPNNVAGLISQRLIQLLCPACKLSLMDNLHLVKNADKLLNRMRSADISDEDLKNVYIKKDSGCSHCANKGSKGKSVLIEIISTDNEFWDLVKKNKKEQAKKYWITHRHGATLKDHAIEKIKMGLVDPRTVEMTVGWLSDSGETQKLDLDSI